MLTFTPCECSWNPLNAGRLVDSVSGFTQPSQGRGDLRLKRYPEDHRLNGVRAQALCQCGSGSQVSAVLI